MAAEVVRSQHLNIARVGFSVSFKKRCYL